MDFGQVRDIPILDVGRLPSGDLCRRDPERARALLRAVLGAQSHPLLPYVTGLLDRVSHSWLVRQANPYLEEIRDVAAVLRRPGAYFLNTVYEWACSTSVAPDPAGGQRMIRVLDWGMAGLGRHTVIARHSAEAGPFYSATWPGYAGVLTAMAPDRFSAAINQAPKMPVSGLAFLDEVASRLRVLRSRGTVPGAHLLRQVFERAPDYVAAVEMLTDESVTLAMPALFSLAGSEPGEGCVIEAIDDKRRVHPSADAEKGALGVANQWLSSDLEGKARNHAVGTGPMLPPEENNRLRRAMVAKLQGEAFSGAADLPEPVLNSHTVMVVVANASRGEMLVEGLEAPEGSVIPRVVARRSIGAAPASARGRSPAAYHRAP
ncbi:MAG TPA: hypothetical protein VKB68_18485 [Stellaceae bacterium]|nr:hypothetical protein [Stellaceae bacterium]